MMTVSVSMSYLCHICQIEIDDHHDDDCNLQVEFDSFTTTS